MRYKQGRTAILGIFAKTEFFDTYHNPPIIRL